MKRQNLSTTRASLSSLLNSARSAMGFEARTAPGFDAPTSIIEKPAVASGWVKLDDNFIPAAKATPGVSFGGQYGDTQSRLDGFILKNSKVAAAGASVIIVNSDPPEGMTGGQDSLALYSRPTNFRVINPAEFSFLDDADPSIYTLMSAGFVKPSDYPVSDAELHMQDAPSHAVRFVISRKQQSMFAPELIEYEVCRSIAAGLANQADETLLKVLANATDDQPTFTLGAAAAKNLAFGDLQALVGTSGTGAFVTSGGDLVAMPVNALGLAGGIAAELTSAIPGTIVGAFNRAAVAISDEVHILVRRMNVDGDMEITAFCQIRALVPDRSFFWTVA